jgi:hypothetical protein
VSPGWVSRFCSIDGGVDAGKVCLPTSFLLDAEGRVRYVLTGPTEWDEGEALRVIEALLAEVPAHSK